MINKVNARSGTFVDNMKMPIHRWFRYSAGFSASWVESEIEKYENEAGTQARLFDPFVGSGTTVFAASARDRMAVGIEGHPFVARIAQAKAKFHLDYIDFFEEANRVLSAAKTIIAKDELFGVSDAIAPLLQKCYEPHNLAKLFALREACSSEVSEHSELLWLCLSSILRLCSGAGTAQWQYVLPNKSKSKVAEPFQAFYSKAELMRDDMEYAHCTGWSATNQIIKHDMRSRFETGDKFNLLISSPPYPNNFDYADATRLEMTFWGEISGWSDLKSVVRPSIMRSCSQHSASDKIDIDEMLDGEYLRPIKQSIDPIVRELSVVRLTKGGKKSYHSMIAAYFTDLAKIFENIRPLMAKGSRICFVIGDSAPYGVHVPAEKWLGELALAHGFNSYSFEKLRDRNVKWKNRTHTVPLHEGRLWIEG